MATIWEAFGSGEGTTSATSGVDESAQREYIVADSDSEDEVFGLAIATAPTMFRGAPLKNVERRVIGYRLWHVTVNYGDGSDSQQQGGPEARYETDPEKLPIEFDTTGGTGRRLLSNRQQAFGPKYYQGDGTQAGPPDFMGAINVRGKNVEGIDVVEPRLKFTLPQLRPAQACGPAFWKRLARLTGRVNKYRIMQFEPGELLFLGAKGSVPIDGSDARIGFEFDASENVKIAPPVPGIPPFDKQGWQYFWVLFEQIEDAKNKAIVQTPRACYLETVYELADFRELFRI